MRRILVALMLVAGMVGHAAAQNLLVNGGFETGDLTGWITWEIFPWGAGMPDWPGHPSYNIYEPGNPNGVIFVKPPAEGEKYLSVQVGFASTRGGVFQTISVIPGMPYKISGYVHLGADGGTEWAQVKYWDGDPGEMDVEIAPVAFGVADVDNGALEYMETVIVPTSDTLTIILEMAQWEAVNYCAGQFDGLSVELVPEPGTIALLLTGLAGVAKFIRRKG